MASRSDGSGDLTRDNGSGKGKHLVTFYKAAGGTQGMVFTKRTIVWKEEISKKKKKR